MKDKETERVKRLSKKKRRERETEGQREIREK